MKSEKKIKTKQKNNKKNILTKKTLWISRVLVVFYIICVIFKQTFVNINIV